MEIDFSKASVGQAYNLMISAIVPRPIAWVSTQSPEGKFNLAPFSYFNAVSSDPATLLFCITRQPDGSKKDTEVNIELTREFVVNIASESLVQAVNTTCAPYPYGVSEFEKAGVTPVASTLVKPPRVREALISMECKLYDSLQVGAEKNGGSIIIVGQILKMHIADEIYDGRGIDFTKLKPLSRLGGQDFGIGTKALTVPRAKI